MARPRRLMNGLGSHFRCPLIEVCEENAVGGFVELLEYHPMMNSRAHSVGKDGNNTILNRTFRATYDKFLDSTVQKLIVNGGQLNDEEKMIFVYYLQLQDRINEAINIFKTVKVPENGESLAIQYDYLLAYFDFFTGSQDGYKLARKISQKYDNHPMSHWRMQFLQIQDQINEFDGEFDKYEEMSQQV